MTPRLRRFGLELKNKLMDTSVELVIRKLLSAVDTYRATDLHLSVGNPPMMRVAGKLAPVPDQPLLTPSFMETIVLSWLDDDDRERLYEKKDLTVAKTFENKKRFRISVFYQQGHLSAALMLVPDIIPTVQQLGLPVAAQQLASVNSGLVLVIGPYGSQQDLTIASFIESRNQNTQSHIVTIEEPVEVLFNDNRSVIDQREVGKDVPSVAQGLKFILEEDVDVVMVTDLSDHDAMRMALQVAGSGKVIYAIMNATTIVGALTTIIHSYPGEDQDQARSELAGNLAGVINQRLVTSVAGDKVMLAEVMVPNDPIKNIIQTGELAQLPNAMQTSVGDPGIRTMTLAVQEAAQRGLITRQDVDRLVPQQRRLT